MLLGALANVDLNIKKYFIDFRIYKKTYILFILRLPKVDHINIF